MAFLSTVYCSEHDLERYLSANAVLDFSDHDGNGTIDDEVIEDCINEATAEIDMYLRQQYEPSDLANHDQVTRWCIKLAARFLCQRRGNVVPDSLEREFERIADPDNGFLARLADSRRQLPGVAKRDDLRPTFSNLTVDRRYNRSTIRRTSTNSSDAPTTLSRDDKIEHHYFYD